ncbi:MAG: hypothetical protein ACAI25_18345 [Planctomycetota bacterium]
MTWTTCSLCKGTGLNPLVLYEDDCPNCDGEGGMELEFTEDDDDPSQPSADVKDED